MKEQTAVIFLYLYEPCSNDGSLETAGQNGKYVPGLGLSLGDEPSDCTIFFPRNTKMQSSDMQFCYLLI